MSSARAAGWYMSETMTPVYSPVSSYRQPSTGTGWAFTGNPIAVWICARVGQGGLPDVAAAAVAVCCGSPAEPSPQAMTTMAHARTSDVLRDLRFIMIDSVLLVDSFFPLSSLHALDTSVHPHPVLRLAAERRARACLAPLDRHGAASAEW